MNVFDDRFYSMRGKAAVNVVGFDRHVSMTEAVVGTPTPPQPTPNEFLLLAHFDGNTRDEVTGNDCLVWSSSYAADGYFSQCLPYTSSQRITTSNVPKISEIINSATQDNKNITISFFSRTYFKRTSGSYTNNYIVRLQGAKTNDTVWYIQPKFSVSTGSDYKIYVTGLQLYHGSVVTEATAQSRYELISAPSTSTFTSWHRFAFHITKTLVTMYIDGNEIVSLDITPYWPLDDYTVGVVGDTYIDELLVCNELYGEDIETQPYVYPQGGD